MRNFLEYIVRQELDGAGEEIKETSIAIEVFGRGAEYDSSLDSTVRVEARRLRSKLAQYYAADGLLDPIRIDIRKGSYRPEFTFTTPVDSTPAAVEAASQAAPSLIPAHIVDTSSVRKFVDPRIRRRTISISIVAIVVVMFLGYGVRQLATDVNQVPTRLVPVTSYAGTKTEPSVSLDGQKLAFAWDGGERGNSQIYVKSLHGEEAPVRVTNSAEHDDAPRWSPDGTLIAFIRNMGTDGAVFVIRPDGKDEKKIAATIGNDVAWTPDGYLAMLPQDPTDRGMILINPVNGSRRYLDIPKDGEIRRFAFSPDGRKLAVDKCDRGCEIFVAPISNDKTGAFRAITRDATLIGAIDWSPDSASVVYSSAKGGIRKLWRAKIPPDGVELPTTSELLAAGVEDAFYPRVVAQGSRYMQVVYLHERMDENVWRIPIVSGAEPASAIIASTRADRVARYSPDGQRIAFISDRGGSRELYVSDRDGRNPVQWTHFAAPDTGEPAWSPNGDRIALTSLIGSNYQIFIVDGPNNPPRLLSDGVTSDFRPSWSRDGQFLYFGSKRTGKAEIWRMTANGADLQRVTFSGGFEAQETADGKWLVVQNDDGLWKLALPNGKPQLLSQNVQNGYWSVVGNQVYFLDFGELTLHERTRDTTRASADVSRISVDTGSIEKLAKIPSTTVFNVTANFAVSPDGRYILLCQIDRADSDFVLLEGIRQ